MKAPVKPPAAPAGRKKDSSSSSEESDSEDEQPTKAPAPSEFIARNVLLLWNANVSIHDLKLIWFVCFI